MNTPLDLVTVGEVLIELSSDKSFKDTTFFEKHYGGDALATAIAGERLGSNVGFITCIGNDPFRDFLLDSWKHENLNIDYVRVVEEQNAVALISRDEGKPKEIACYRKKTAPQKLSIDDINADYIKNAKYFYTTGITQSLSISAKEAVKKCYTLAKESNTITAYDPNYKQVLLTKETAKENFEDVISDIDILFLSAKNDIPSVFDTDSIENVIKHCWDMGVQIVIVKSTKNSGYYTGYNGDIVFCKYFAKTIVDTTGSGDAFNGAFLSSMAKGATPFEATRIASVVSGLQAQHIGAIKSIPEKTEVLAKLNEAEEEL